VDVWTWIAVVVAFGVIIAFAPHAFLRHWSWRAQLEKLRR
jgi:H+/Cl- antiporter ClcA